MVIASIWQITPLLQLVAKVERSTVRIRVDYIDTFFLLNRPGTNQWYTSLSNVTFANLTGTITPTTTAQLSIRLDIVGKDW
jgi:hypothetical protein